MTDAELSLAIAEMIEPKPRWTCGTTTEGKAYTVNPLRELALTPRDFVNDPACTMMLLSLPGFVSLYHVEDEDGEDEPTLYEADFCGEDVHSADCGDKIKMVRNARIGRAVAEAFYLANKETKP